jgi:hypothetical protein
MILIILPPNPPCCDIPLLTTRRDLSDILCGSNIYIYIYIYIHTRYWSHVVYSGVGRRKRGEYMSL